MIMSLLVVLLPLLNSFVLSNALLALHQNSILNFRSTLVAPSPSLKNVHDLSLIQQRKKNKISTDAHLNCLAARTNEDIEEGKSSNNDNELNRQDFFAKSLQGATIMAVVMSMHKEQVSAKCTDIETCREIGEKKVEQDMIDNPTIRLDSGVRYKVLQPGVLGSNSAEETVKPDSNIDLIFSVSTLSGGYMYSRGFGFEKIDVGDGKLQSDLGLDSLRVQLGQKDVPIGIEDALVGMRKGERRRVELPPRVGFETSQWKPEPTTRRGITRIVGYKQLLEGNGSTRPPFPAATIWDIEVLRIRK